MLSADFAPPRRLADTLSSLYRRILGDDHGPRLRRVGVVVVDGLGSDLLLHASGHARFLASRLNEHGEVGHSGLPSTTASALASITTGVEAGEHGLLGYQVRDPETGSLVNHLKNFPPGVTPRQWQQVPTIFEQAAQHSIPSLTVGESRFSGTDFSEAILRGADFQGSNDLDDHLQLLREFFDSHDEAVAYLYWPALDRIGHQLGVAHAHWVDALEDVDVFAKKLSAELAPGEALILTADHGMVDVVSENQIMFPADHPLRQQVTLWAGEPRLVHLYLAEGVDAHQFATALADFGRGQLSPVVRDEAISRGVFGAVAQRNRERIGDVVVFSEGQVALYDEISATESSRKMVGQHGSWTPREVSVPIIPLGPVGD